MYVIIGIILYSICMALIFFGVPFLITLGMRRAHQKAARYRKNQCTHN